MPPAQPIIVSSEPTQEKLGKATQKQQDASERAERKRLALEETRRAREAAAAEKLILAEAANLAKENDRKLVVISKFISTSPPPVRCYSLSYVDSVGGIPFLLGADLLGVAYKDGSCITISTNSVVTYVNKNHHRFSLLPPNKDTKLTVPLALEKKFLAVLWVREVFTHQESARGALGFVDVATGTCTVNSDDQQRGAARTVSHESYISPSDFIAACAEESICPLAALAKASGSSKDRGPEEPTNRPDSESVKPTTRALGRQASLPPLISGPLPPLPLYVAAVYGVNGWPPSKSTAKSEGPTFVVSNNSSLYPGLVYYDSDSE
eukprot:GILI01018274.1.p1 GENE.GILI01018274.1~~GILI01018274.1.p1  ORF type:complete len:335 (-),score=51.62 GILI01018274.1:77-1045(-)